MYRSVLVSFVLVATAATAATACKGSARSASAASTHSAASSRVAGTAAQSANTSDTSGTPAGPIATTQRPAPGSAASTTGAGVTPASASTPGAAASPNPNRVPNEMGRIMVLEYHLITDHNADYARERGQFRKDLELLYDRGYRPVNMSDVLDKKLDLPRGISPVVVVFDDASPEQCRYLETNGKLEIDPTSRSGLGLDFTHTPPH